MSFSELTTIIVALVASVALSAGCIRAIHPLLVRYAMARPNARSSHKVPTPQGAGIAVIAATLVIAALAQLWTATPLPWALIGASLVIAVVGAVDDLRPMPVLPRFGLQALCVLAVLLAMPADLRIASWLPLGVERAVLLLAMLWFVNLTNFMDGLDWMTVAEIVPVTAALALIGLAGLVPLPVAILAATLCGGLIGFAPFNRPVAKMFLGDVGSLPIGLILSWCLVQLACAGHLAAAVLLPLYYLCDATITLLRRIIRREQFWQAHRSHFYQRATDNGFTVTAVVGRVFTLNILLAVLAAASLTSVSLPIQAALLVAGVAAVAWALVWFATPRR